MDPILVLFKKSDRSVIARGTMSVCGPQYAKLGFSPDYGIMPAEQFDAPADPPTVTTTPDLAQAFGLETTPGVVFSSPDMARASASGEDVSAIAAERVARHEQALLSLGIALPPPVYAPGTVVNSWGVENFSTKRQEWADMPLIVDALREVQDNIRKERRKDLVIEDLSTLRMTPEGFITRGSGDLPLEEGGMRLLLAAMEGVFPRAMPVMLKAKPAVRAEFFNAMMDEYGPELAGTAAKFRTREFDGVRSVFAVVSTTYGVRDADTLAEDIIQGLGDDLYGARGEVVYDPSTTNFRVNALWHAQRVVDLAAGDVFQVGASYSSNDARGGSIVVDATALRNLCRNLIILGSGSANLLRRRHRGSMADVSGSIADRTAKVLALVDTFATDWGLLRNKEVSKVTLWGEKFNTVPDALEWAVKEGKIDVEVKKAVLTETLLTGWKAEQGNSLADLVNAITRCHLSEAINQWQREQLERAAGELVPVLVRAAQ